MARPIEFTEEVVKKLEEAFALDCTVSEACLMADISRETYYQHIKKKPELADRFEELRSKPVLKARQTVISSLSTPHDAQWYLERKRKDEFSPRSESVSKVEAEIKVESAGLVEAVKAFEEAMKPILTNKK